MQIVNQVMKNSQVTNALKKMAIPAVAGLMLTTSTLTASATNKKVESDIFVPEKNEILAETKEPVANYDFDTFCKQMKDKANELRDKKTQVDDLKQKENKEEVDDSKQEDNKAARALNGFLGVGRIIVEATWIYIMCGPDNYEFFDFDD